MTHRSRIVEAAGRRPGEAGSFGDLGPGEPALGEWASRGLALPDLVAMRRHRLGRLREQLARCGYGGALLTDPINVRYATDSTNMQVWCLHNPVRYAFVATAGPVVLFDFHGSAHLSDHLELVDEVRHGRSWFYFETGTNTRAAAEAWAKEIAALVDLHGAGDRRLAVDRLDPIGAAALGGLGVTVVDGQEVAEVARSIKSSDEIAAMRCVVDATERSIEVMRAALVPGVTEQTLWSHLHAENVRRGGEWIETRLLTSGPRTNPWFQECSSRVIEAGDLVAFDTDLIGAYGYCADLSRTWICGDARPSADQRQRYRLAVEQIEHNMALLRPGAAFLEVAERSFPLPERYRGNRYSVVLHGVGLCDEYPAVVYAEDAAYAYDGTFEAGMTLCVESYVGDEGGQDGIKLEQQILITTSGVELLSTSPYEASFLG